MRAHQRTTVMLAPEFDALEARIHSLEIELAELRHQRNNFLAISRLPDEIVVDIFKTTQHGCQKIDHLKPWATYDSSWTSLMLACRRFRSVALQAPLLWTLVDYAHQEDWMNLCLERSRSSALYVHDKSGRPLTPNCFCRARSVHVQVVDTATAEVLNSIAPCLHTLEIDSGYDEDDDPYFFITSSLLGSTNTSIVHLSLSHVQLQAFPTMPSLHRLELDSVHLKNMEILGLALQDVPQIQELCLRRLAITRPNTGHSAISPRDTSLSLQSLLIEDDRDRVLAYLRTLPLPTQALGLLVQCPDTVVALTGAAYEAQPIQEISNIWSTFSNQMRSTAQLADGTLTMYGHLRTSVHFGTWAFDDTTSSLESFGHRSPSFYTLFCGRISEHLSLADLNITTLHLGSRSWERRPSLSLSFDDSYHAGLLPRLRALTLEGYHRADVNTEARSAINSWIRGRSGRIRQVRFIGCSETMRPLADEVLHGIDGPAIIWEQQHVADRGDGYESPSEASEW